MKTDECSIRVPEEVREFLSSMTVEDALIICKDEDGSFDYMLTKDSRKHFVLESEN